MTGTIWVGESGLLSGPVMITNTHSVGSVRDAVIAWQARRGQLNPWALPVVAETYDGWLNDINGFHVRERHVRAALKAARGGRVAEGSVGGGTGMIGYEFKGGIGTASRVVPRRADGYTIGVLVQLNCGLRDQLMIAGVPVGREILEHRPFAREQGSIIVVIATDAPLLPHQLRRVAVRATLGLARTGSISGNSSGDIFIAFSTANPGAGATSGIARIAMIPNERIDPIFAATVQATEEAIINALVAAETMTGRDDHMVIGIPHDRVRELMRKYAR
jgi:D-aminopeptidase